MRFVSYGYGLFTGLSTVFLDFRSNTRAPRICPSWLGIRSTVLPSSHFCLGCFSSYNSPRSFFAGNNWFFGLKRFWHSRNEVTHSKRQHFQKCSIRLSTYSVRFGRSGSTISELLSQLRFSWYNLCPNNKWFSVITSYISSSYNVFNGREFIIIYISDNTIWSLQKFKHALPTVFFKQRLTIEIICSQKPPYHGALDKMNCHSIFPFVANFFVSYEVKTVPLSVNIFPGQPRRDINFLRL